MPHSFFREVKATDLRSGEETVLYHSNMISDNAEPPEMGDRKVSGTPSAFRSKCPPNLSASGEKNKSNKCVRPMSVTSGSKLTGKEKSESS